MYIRYLFIKGIHRRYKNVLYEKYLNVIDEKKDLFCSVLDKIWDNPENIFKEYAAL